MGLTAATRSFVNQHILKDHEGNVDARKTKIEEALARLPEGNIKTALRSRLGVADRNLDRKQAYHELKQVKRDARAKANEHADSVTKDGVERRLLQFEDDANRSAVTRDKLAQLQRDAEALIARLAKESHAMGAKYRADWEALVEKWQPAIKDYEAIKPEETYMALDLDIGILSMRKGLAQDANVLRGRLNDAKAKFMRGGEFLSAAMLQRQLKINGETFSKLLMSRVPFEAHRQAAKEEIEAAMQHPWRRRQLISVVQAMDDAAERGNYRAAEKALADAIALARLTDEQIAQRVEDAAAAVLPSEEDEEQWARAHAEWEKKTDLSKRSVGNRLGKGGMGAIYALVSDRKDSSGLVWKTQANGGTDEMEHEAAMYAKVGPHPNIARCLGVQEVQGKKGLVLEALTGGDMSDVIAQMNELHKSGKLREQEYWGIMQFSLARTLEALAYMEKKGVVHRDIKPPNIMFDEDSGEPKLVDLGISADTGGKNKGNTMGYSPVESPAQSNQDSFAIGATAYEVQRGNTGQDKDLKHRFNYGGAPGGVWEMKALNYGKGKGAPQALQVSRQADQVFGVDKEQVPVKKFGAYGAETAYVEFVNWLLHPDPAKRPKPAEALQHPFMQQRMLDDESARGGIKRVIASRKQRNVGDSAAQPVRPDPKEVRQQMEGLLQAKILDDAKRFAGQAPRALRVAQVANGRLDSRIAVSTKQIEELRALLGMLSKASDSLIEHRRQVTEVANTLREDDDDLKGRVRVFTQESMDVLQQLRPVIEAIGRLVQRADPTPRKAAKSAADHGMEALAANKKVQDGYASARQARARDAEDVVRSVEEASSFEKLVECLRSYDLEAATAVKNHVKQVMAEFDKPGIGKAEIDMGTMEAQARKALSRDLNEPVLGAVAKAIAFVMVRR